MISAPTRTVGAEGDPVYSQLHSAAWRCKMQNRHPLGATIVPLICGSDETPLTNFSSHQKAWLIYRTFGNIDSSLGNKYSNLALVSLAFHLVPPKFQHNSASNDQVQSDIDKQVLSDIAGIVLEPVRRFPKGGDIISGAQWPCSDSTMRHCWPILGSWWADHMEDANLMGVKYNACPKCQTPKDKLGSLILPPDLEFHRRKSAVFQQNCREYHIAKTAWNNQAIMVTEDWFKSVSAKMVSWIV